MCVSDMPKISDFPTSSKKSGSENLFPIIEE